MTDQHTPETDAEMLLRPPSFNPADMAYKFARALEIQRNAARADAARLLSELADERAKKSDALIAAVNDIERLRANNQELKELLFALARAIHDENWKEIGNLVPRMNAAFATPAQ